MARSRRENDYCSIINNSNNGSYAPRSPEKLAFIVIKQRLRFPPVAYLQNWRMVHGPDKWGTEPSELI